MKRNSNKILTAAEEAELKRNALSILTDVRKTMLQRFPFVGAVAMSLDLVPVRDVDCPTAATDGAAMYWNIEFLAELKPEERLFVFAHEVYHNIMMHSLRRDSRNHQLFNIACDIEVNQLLENDGLVAPKDGCFIKNRNHPNGYSFAPNLSAEQYYELLLKNADRNTAAAGKSGNGSLDGQFDIHIFKDDEYEPSGNETSDKYGKVRHDPDFRPNVTEGNVEHIRESAIAAAQAIERQAGSLPAHLKKIVNSLTEAKADWKEVLSQFVTRSCGDGDRTWNRCNRRFAASGTYLPAHESTRMNVAVVLDTSGSVTGMLPQFLGELNSLVKSFGNYKLTVIQNDCEVEDVAEYTDDSPLDLENVKFKVHGYGGTDLAPAFKHIVDNCIEADCIVAMTDGEFGCDINASICSIPTMWLLPKNGKKEHITFGEIVDYED